MAQILKSHSKRVHALQDNFQCFPTQQSGVAENGLQLVQTLSNGCSRSYPQGVLRRGHEYSWAVKKGGSSQIQGAASKGGTLYALGLINAGCGSGCSVEGYLCKTLKVAQGKVVRHRVALGLSIAGMGGKNTEVYIPPCLNNSHIPSFCRASLLRLLVAISSWFLTCYPTSSQMLIAFHTNQPHIQFREWGYFWTHEPTPSTVPIGAIYISPSTQTNELVTVSQGVK